jgi:hypothetical protein
MSSPDDAEERGYTSLATSTMKTTTSGNAIPGEKLSKDWQPVTRKESLAAEVLVLPFHGLLSPGSHACSSLGPVSDNPRHIALRVFLIVLRISIPDEALPDPSFTHLDCLWKCSTMFWLDRSGDF